MIVRPPLPLVRAFTRTTSVLLSGSRTLKLTVKAFTPGWSVSVNTVEMRVVEAPSRLTGEVPTDVAPADTPPTGERPTLGQIVAYYKYETTVQINEQCGYDPARFWQRSFYDQIIRNRRALDAVRQYIADNPPNWELDRDHPNNLPSTQKGTPYVH